MEILCQEFFAIENVAKVGFKSLKVFNFPKLYVLPTPSLTLALPTLLVQTNILS